MRTTSDQRARRGGRPGRWWPGIAVALAFLAVGLATLPDYGTTWDERESYDAGRRNLEILATLASGSTSFEWPWHELRGYQFVFDTARAGFARVVGPGLGGPDDLRGFHLFNLLLAAASLVLVHRIAVGAGAGAGVGGLAALVLATTPKFVAHSQNNPKDLIGLFVFALAVWAIVRATERGTRGGFVLAGVGVGLAFASHVLSALLVPLAVVWVLVAAPAASPPRRRWREPLVQLTILFAFAAVASFLLWPWLWADPVIRVARVLRRVAFYPVGMPVLYLGTIYPDANPPFHYGGVSLLVATPVLFTAAAVAGAAVALARSAGAGRRRLAALAILWTGSLVVPEALASSRYDGVRHLLPVLPALALLAGLGLERALAGLVALWRRGGAWRVATPCALSLLVLAWGLGLADLVRLHPYEDAYLNPPTLRLLERPPEEVFELEYWGNSYKEGAEWLDTHAADGAVVLVPIASWCAEPWLDDRFTLVEADSYPATGRPRYLMFMTREGFYTPAIRRLRRTLAPVFSVRRGRATLLEIYRLS